MQKLFKRKMGNKKKEQLILKASTLSTLGVINQFYINPISNYYRRPSIPPVASLLGLKLLPITPLPRP